MNINQDQIELPLAPHPQLAEPAMAAPPLHHPSDKGLMEELREMDVDYSIDWELENDKIKTSSTVPESIRKILGGRWSTQGEKAVPDLESAASNCSPSALEKIEKDIEKAGQEVKCLDKLVVPRARLVPMIRELAKIYPQSSIQMSGMFLYPAGGGYMGWHTNSDAPCTRVYIASVKEGDKSFFRYRLNGEYVTSWDKAGWNIREFETTKEEPLWHCVYAEEKRFSIGFRINRNLL